MHRAVHRRPGSFSFGCFLRRFGSPRRSWLLGVVVVAAMGLAASRGSALEGQWREGIEVGANLSKHGKVGPQAGAFAAYGVTESLDFRLEALGSLQPGADGRRDLIRLGGALLYKLEVTEWVPYLGLGGGFAWVISPQSSGAVVEPVAGFSYLWTRNLGFGIEYRLGAFVDDEVVSPVHQAMFQLEHRFGW